MRKRKIYSILTTAAVIAALSSSFVSLGRFWFNQPQEKQYLVALGDSITYGYNLEKNNEHPSTHAFPYLISNREEKKPFLVADLAQPGWTSDDLIQALKTDKFKQALKEADVITLDIGSNDLLHAAGGVVEKFKADPHYQPQQQELQDFMLNAAKAEETFRTNLGLIIRAVREQSRAQVILYTLYNPFPQGTQLHQVGEVLLSSMNKLILDYPGSNPDSRIVTADAHAAFQGKEQQLVRTAANDIHPTIEGQAVLAGLAEQSLYGKSVEGK